MATTRLGLLGSWAAYLGFSAKETAAVVALVVGTTQLVGTVVTTSALVGTFGTGSVDFQRFDHTVFDPAVFDIGRGVAGDPLIGTVDVSTPITGTMS